VPVPTTLPQRGQSIAMRLNEFGLTGLKVSALGFGSWPMAGSSYGNIEERAAVAAVDRALDAGINCFDTAPAYGFGEAEVMLGRALGKRRADVILASKCGIALPEGSQEAVRDCSPTAITNEVELSLKRLGTDYLDVVLLHWPELDTPFEQSMLALDELVQRGKARFVGVSNFTVVQMQTCMQARRIDVVQVGYNLFDRRMEQEVLPYCAEHGIAVMGYGSLAHGLLTGGFAPDTVFDPADWRSIGIVFGQPLFRGANFGTNVEVVNRLAREVAAPRGMPVAQVALAWALSNPTVSTALVGARSPEEIDANVGAVDATLSEAELSKIDDIMRGAAGRVTQFLPLESSIEQWGEEIPVGQ
jgi:aryl-alcohol dehydrogenase-like predicted oxidoreductase